MSIQELSMHRFIMYFKESNSGVHPQKFCFVLGAGASVSSGIPSGESLVKTWEKELMEADGGAHQAWKESLGITPENQAQFYSQYYERRFLEPSDGYNYMEQLMDKATPSVGYAALAYLLCRPGNSSNVVLTTNFDHLAEDAVSRHQELLPLVVGHEALSHYVTHYIREGIQRPIVVKIHRDLLMEPKNTSQEIEQLDPDWEAPLNELFAHYHPVFIGYAGNDKSMMDFLSRHTDKFQKNIWKRPYWTVFGRRPLQGKARDFLEAAKGSVLYDVDFDELMICLGDSLGFKLIAPEEAAARVRQEQEAFLKKLTAVLEKRARANAAVQAPMASDGAKGTQGPRSGETEAASSAAEGSAKKPKSSDPAGPKRLNDAIGRITGDTDPASRSARYLLAVMAHNSGNYEESESLLRKLIAEDPDNGEYHDILSTTLHEMERYDEAEAETRQAIALDPDNAEYHYSLAVTLHAMKRYDEAEAETRRAIALDPDNAEYHYSLAVTLHEMKRYDEAEVEKRRAIALDPDNAEYHQQLGVTLHVMKRYDEAVAETRRAIALDPDNAKYHQQLGVTLHEMERYDEAVAETRRAIALDPDNGEYHHSLAVTLHAMKRYDEAVAETRRAIALDPDNAKYHDSLGTTLHEMKRYDEAVAEKQRAIALDPDNAKYHQQLGVTLHEMDRYDEAEAETRRAIALDPDNAKYHQQLGVTLHEMDRYDEAEAETRRAIALDPDNAEYHYSLAVTLHAMKRYDEVEAETRRAIALDPDNSEYHKSLGATLQKMKRYDEAETEKRKAIELDPDNGEYHDSLAITLRAAGKLVEADQEEKKAKALRKQAGQ